MRHLAPLLQSGDYDALFCPQDEFFDLVFAENESGHILSGLHCITLYSGDAPRRSRRYQELNIEEWKLDPAGMLVQALEMLQDMTLTRRALTRTVRISIQRTEKGNPQMRGTIATPVVGIPEVTS